MDLNIGDTVIIRTNDDYNGHTTKVVGIDKDHGIAFVNDPMCPDSDTEFVISELEPVKQVFNIGDEVMIQNMEVFEGSAGLFKGYDYNYDKCVIQLNWGGVITCRPDQITKINPISDIPPIPEAQGCTHSNKYKNVISANLKFWSCPDCGKDLGDA